MLRQHIKLVIIGHLIQVGREFREFCAWGIDLFFFLIHWQGWRWRGRWVEEVWLFYSVVCEKRSGPCRRPRADVLGSSCRADDLIVDTDEFVCQWPQHLRHIIVVDQDPRVKIGRDICGSYVFALTSRSIAIVLINAGKEQTGRLISELELMDSLTTEKPDEVWTRPIVYMVLVKNGGVTKERVIFLSEKSVLCHNGCVMVQNQKWRRWTVIGLYSLVMLNFWSSTAQDWTSCHMTYFMIIDCNATPPINTFLPCRYLPSILDLV